MLTVGYLPYHHSVCERHRQKYRETPMRAWAYSSNDIRNTQVNFKLENIENVGWMRLIEARWKSINGRGCHGQRSVETENRRGEGKIIVQWNIP